MRFELAEQDLVFRFDAERFLKWDGHPAETRGVGRLPTSKAVDVCLGHDDGSATLFEITDYRGFEPQARRVIRGNELVEETARKVRDSVAGMLWAAGRQLAREDWFETLVGKVVNRERKLLVVLWCEGIDPAAAATLSRSIEGSLKPALSAKVVVTNRALEAQTRSPLPWVAVSGRPGAIR